MDGIVIVADKSSWAIMQLTVEEAYGMLQGLQGALSDAAGQRMDGYNARIEAIEEIRAKRENFRSWCADRFITIAPNHHKVESSN
jgi:hypothetical protein